MADKAKLTKLLASQGQEQLLRFWENLSAIEQDHLAQQILSVDWELVRSLISPDAGSEKTFGEKINWSDLADRIESPPAVRLGDPPTEQFARFRKQAEAQLSAGKVAVVLVAGGQGTRLGFDLPKGMYEIGPVSHASLFQILLEKLLAVRTRYQARIPLCVMTSPATHAETENYFQRMNYFGLPPEDVRLFCQGVLPAVDAVTGKILLAAANEPALSPDGHGGMLRAMTRSGLLDQLRDEGIEKLFYLQVDNPLVEMCDPDFLAHHDEFQSELSTQVVVKREPLERVGNVVSIDGQLRIIEYSDMPEQVAKLKNPDGSLKIWAGNIAVHLFNLDFLRRVEEAHLGLPFHKANKKVSYVDEQGKIVEPDKPNAVKFEQFIFDLLPLARRSMVMEVDAQTHFAPLKNAPGSLTDSPETVRAMMIALHTHWLRQAGVEVSAETAVEISPLYATDVEELRRKISADPRLEQRAGKPWVTKPLYFR